MIGLPQRQPSFGMTRQVCFMKPCQHIPLKQDYYTHYFLTLRQWNVSYAGVPSQLLSPLCPKFNTGFEFRLVGVKQLLVMTSVSA